MLGGTKIAIFVYFDINIKRLAFYNLEPAGHDDRGEKIISFSKSKVRVTFGSR